MIGCVLLALACRAGVHSTTPRVASGWSPYASIESYSAFPAKRLVFQSRGGDSTAHAIPAPSTLFYLVHVNGTRRYGSSVRGRCKSLRVPSGAGRWEECVRPPGGTAPRKPQEGFETCPMAEVSPPVGSVHCTSALCAQLKMMTVVVIPYGSVVAQCMQPQPIDWPATSALQCCHCVLVGLAR